ncbi:putative leader peptide [Kitasatospora sp. NPDC059327]
MSRAVVLTTRAHVDLCRVTTAACPAAAPLR